MNYTLSNQAVGAIMMALQNSLMTQTDIVPMLTGFQIQVDDTNQLIVTNPPVVETPSAETNTPTIKGNL
jgi:acetyl-CoA carboxylase carboxyltransferase component